MGSSGDVWGGVLLQPAVVIAGVGFLIILLIVALYLIVKSYAENSEYRERTGKDDN